MSADVRYPREFAQRIAAEIVARLSPFTERIEVAGSLRREKPDVGDIEIVYIPKQVRGKVGLLDEMVNAAETQLESWLNDAFIYKRLNSLNRATWGSENKLAVHTDSGIPVDFFATTEASWWNYLVCRTGGAENNRTIASAARMKGWQWQPYSEGFKTQTGYRQVTSERDCFAAVGLPYKEPKDRV